MYELKGNKPIELLRWLLSTIEGQWLMKTSAAYGSGEAIKLSSKVRSAFGKTEMKAMLALIGKSKADDLADSIEIIQTYLTLVYGERGWVGSFRQTGGNNGGVGRIEIEVIKCGALDNLKKAASGGEGLALACEMMWNSWFEVLLPEWQIEVTSQFSGASGRTSDLYTVACFPQDFEVEVPMLETAEPQPTPVQAPPPPPISPVAAALQMVEEPPAPPVNMDYTSYTPPIQATPPVQNNPWPPSAQPSTSLAPIPPANIGPQGGSLAERMANKRASQTSEQPQTIAEPPAPPPPPALRYDLKSGQALFAKDYDKEAKESVERSERKRNKIMQKLFISKEARQLMEEGGDKPLTPEFSLATGIENILQQLIAQENTLQPGSIPEQVHVVSGADGDLQIHVGTRVYSAVGDVPPGRIRELLQTSVERWGESHGF